MAQLLRRFGAGKVWSIATATCDTYLRCKVHHPVMEVEWDLQAVPIARGTVAALRCVSFSFSPLLLDPPHHSWINWYLFY
jgi:hypothetical protein